jgi:isoamylase
LRTRKKRAILTTLLCSQGVAMLLAGDEIGHTQRGNNNCYCQDNDITWLNWSLDDAKKQLLDFTRRLVRLYFSQPVLQRRRFFHGEKLEGSPIPDILWLDPNGREMAPEAWDVGYVRCLGVQLYGKHVDVNEHGDPINGDTLLILFNGDQKLDIPFTLPAFDGCKEWQRLLDTADSKADDAKYPVGQQYPLRACSVAILRVLGADAQPIPVTPSELSPASTTKDLSTAATITDVQTASPMGSDAPNAN